MGYKKITEDDIISLKGEAGEFSVYKYDRETGEVTLLPIKRDSRGCTIIGNALKLNAREVRRRATYVGHVANERLN